MIALKSILPLSWYKIGVGHPVYTTLDYVTDEEWYYNSIMEGFTAL